MKKLYLLFFVVVALGLAGSGCESRALGDTWTRPADEMVMVYVPKGEFDMGSVTGDGDEQPVHAVELDGFWIDRTEVTNAQYAPFLSEKGGQADDGVTWLDFGDEDSLITRSGGAFEPKGGYGDHPVIEVSWWGARAYCEWAGARLPAEAEWEYAARGPYGNDHPWGDQFDCSRGNFDDETIQDDFVALPGGEGCDGYERTAAVGSFPGGASWCGALDLAGNVWEWVEDWYDDYPSGRQVNPAGPSTGNSRVLRGGSWVDDPMSVRGANRGKYAPDAAYYFNGFRCAKDAD